MQSDRDDENTSEEERAEMLRRRAMLRGLIAETQQAGPRYAKELDTFAESFSHTCGHNRLEQIGLRWSVVLTPAQTQMLVMDNGAAISFASHLHQTLMRHLLPSENELSALPKKSVMQWAACLRMGIQGVLRQRALVSGSTLGNRDFGAPTEDFLLTMQPVIRHAADEFFRTEPA